MRTILLALALAAPVAAFTTPSAFRSVGFLLQFLSYTLLLVHIISIYHWPLPSYYFFEGGAERYEAQLGGR